VWAFVKGLPKPEFRCSRPNDRFLLFERLPRGLLAQSIELSADEERYIPGRYLTGYKTCRFFEN
jgi:hypothetical protein